MPNGPAPPDGRIFTTRKVLILGSSGEVYPGTARVQTWTAGKRFWRGLKRSARIVGACLLVILPFAVIEPFAFLLWGSVVLGFLFLFLGPFLHLKYWCETTSFEHVESHCPSCKTSQLLRPYVSTAFEPEFTVLCPACGQTAKAHAVN